MPRKAKFALDERRTSDGDGQAEAGGEEDRVLSPNTQERPRGGLTGSESRRGATPRHTIRYHMRGQPVASCSQLPSIKEGGAEATVVDRSLAEKGTRSPSADVSARGLSFSD